VTSQGNGIDRSCGPSGCELDWLTSQRHRIDDDDIAAFTAFANQNGWGDGLPLIPPTEARVREMLSRSGRFPDEIIAVLPPLGAECTVEKAAINAVLAGAPPHSLPLILAAVEAMADPLFNLSALNTTTGSVVPAVLVNGPNRDFYGIPYDAGCFGGTAVAAPAVGRAIRLIMRNIGGQLIGVTSQAVFGQPGRVCGIMVGEWEERSPWAPLAERRAGVAGDAVTVYGAMGTTNIADMEADDGRTLLEVLGKGLAQLGANGFLPQAAFSEVFLAINPTWADMIARDVPAIEDVARLIWNAAALPIDWFPRRYRAGIEAVGRLQADGRVHLVQDPADVVTMVCGGLGSLHAMAMHSWGDTRTVTRPVATVATAVGSVP